MILGFYGASGLGTEYRGLADRISEEQDRWEGYIFVDDDPQKVGTMLNDLPILSFDQAIEKYGIDGIEFIISIGENAIKDIVFKKLCEKNAKIATLIHPEIEVRLPKGFKAGKGLLVHRNGGVGPNVTYGNNVLIQGMSVVGHNVVLGDNVVLSSFAFVGGDTVVGRNTYIGPHSCIRNGLHIGENVVIGMGAVVTKDVPDNAVVVGNPAKILRYNEKGRVFSK